MPGSSNFLPWGGASGPSSNIESDSSYNSDSLRAGGVPTNAILPSQMLNKLFLQATMMVAALGSMMSTKGYVVSDASLTTLAAVLANIVTQNDLAASPALGGNPTATTQATGNNSTRIASTAFVIAEALAILAASPALGGTPTAPTQVISDNSTAVATTAFVQALIASGFSITSNYIIFPDFLGGLIIQWAQFAIVPGVTNEFLPTPFLNNFYAVFTTQTAGSGSNPTNANGSGLNQVALNNTNSGNVTVFVLAIGN